jgi:hypothetical protein
MERAPEDAAGLRLVERPADLVREEPLGRPPAAPQALGLEPREVTLEQAREIAAHVDVARLVRLRVLDERESSISYAHSPLAFADRLCTIVHS